MGQPVAPAAGVAPSCHGRLHVHIIGLEGVLRPNPMCTGRHKAPDVRGRIVQTGFEVCQRLDVSTLPAVFIVPYSRSDLVDTALRPRAFAVVVPGRSGMAAPEAESRWILVVCRSSSKSQRSRLSSDCRVARYRCTDRLGNGGAALRPRRFPEAPHKSPHGLPDTTARIAGYHRSKYAGDRSKGT